MPSFHLKKPARAPNQSLYDYYYPDLSKVLQTTDQSPIEVAKSISQQPNPGINPNTVYDPNAFTGAAPPPGAKIGPTPTATPPKKNIEDVQRSLLYRLSDKKPILPVAKPNPKTPLKPTPAPNKKKRPNIFGY